MQSGKLLDNPYIVINYTFVLLILLIIVYSKVLGVLPEELRVKSQCISENIDDCKSYGLSRSFHLITNFRFEEAKNMNPYSLRIFSFFFVQLLLRVLSSWLYVRKHKDSIIVADVVISTVYFLYTFLILRI